MPTQTPTKTGDYHILPLTHPSTHSSLPKPTTSYLYLKPHSPSNAVAESTSTYSRSLFIANIPVDATIAQFRSFFAREELGSARVEDVEFDGSADSSSKKRSLTNVAANGGGRKNKKRKRNQLDADTSFDDLVPDLPSTWDREVHRSGATAVVVFVDKPSMDIAITRIKKSSKTGTALEWSFPELAKAEKLGTLRYKTHHDLTFPSSEALQKAINAYMTSFAAAETAVARMSSKTAGVADEDGFVTVTRGGRGGGAKVDERRAEELREAEQAKKKRDLEKREGLGDFYRFQGRERRKAEALGVQGRFEGVKGRVFGKGRDGG